MQKTLRQILILCAIALVPATLCALFHPSRPAWVQEPLTQGEMMPADVLRWKDKPLWVDARSKANFDRDHIPGALLLNEDHWDELLPAVLSAWKPEQSIVVYCDDKLCDSSKQVAARLREAGIGPVYVLKGGWESVRGKIR